VPFRGTNLWLLVCAIFVASVGLNVNSTAVIIGAMLISPLMGPIMGMGYGAAINDTKLMAKALGNLLLAVVLSLTASALYFWLSPLTEAQSELLARTSPNLWDVLIAVFGGVAGSIGVTRRERSNVLPGVAIATALMPPLCTAGYGLAHANFSFFIGAFYLFCINSVFIAASTLLVSSYLHMPRSEFASPLAATRVRRLVYFAVTVTALPSAFLAVRLVQTELFSAAAGRFVTEELKFHNAHVIGHRLSMGTKTLQVTMIGAHVEPAPIRAAQAKLGSYRLDGVQLVVHQNESARFDIPRLKDSMLVDVYKAQQDQQHLTEQQLGTMRTDLREVRRQAAALTRAVAELAVVDLPAPPTPTLREQLNLAWPQISAELSVIFPEAQTVTVEIIAPVDLSAAPTADQPPSRVVVSVPARQPLTATDVARLGRWLELRLATIVDLGGAPVEVRRQSAPLQHPSDGDR